MRKFVVLIINVLILILFFCESAFAKTIDERIIRQIAQNFLKKTSTIHTRALNKQLVYSIHKIEQINHLRDNSALAHIVSIQPKGFLIISPLPGYKPVIAYSFNHSWNPDIDENDFIYTLMRLDLDLRKENIKKYSNDNIDLTSYDWDSGFELADITTSDRWWPERGITDTGGWINTTWYQSEPYNNFCPMDTTAKKRSLVGCVGLAIAQIVKFHGHLGDFKLNYEGFEYKSVSENQRVHIDPDSSVFDFPGFSKLNSYLDDIRTKFNITHEELNDSEIAALCFVCGILIETDYSNKLSSPDAYVRYNISKSITDKLTYASADFENFNQRSEFNNIMIDNITNKLPVILSIKSSLGGHAVIVDGYNTMGYFHLNYGWGDTEPKQIWDVWWNGIQDSLPDSYNRVMDAIVNISPNKMHDLSLHTPKTTLKFPPSLIGGLGIYREITIKNTCDLYLTINWIGASENFVPITPTFLPGVTRELRPDEELDVFILCQPKVPGLFYGKLQVFASYGDQSTYLGIDLIGEGEPGTWIDPGSVSDRWRSESSPYYIQGDIYIEEGKRLIIEPGTEIIFEDSYAFTISQNAQLIARGTESDSIYFKAENENKGWQGILFQNSGSDDTLAYCVLSDANRTATNPLHLNRGGVISIDNSSPTITHSKIINNTNKNNLSGGGMYLDNSNASMSHLRFEENVSPKNGGALYMVNSSPMISKTIFCNNQASSGGAIYAYKSSPTLTNVTIANNKATDDGGAIALGKECYIHVENSIIWGNEIVGEGEGKGEGYTLAFLSSSGSSSISFNYSNIDTMGNDWLFTKGQEQIDWLYGIHCTDPFFTNPQNFIYTLQEGSPCIDAGNPDPRYNDTEDLPDNPGYARPPAMGTVRNDMGALGGPDVITKIERKFAIPPSTFILYQNYPNPFNPKTVISYQLPVTSHSDLSIYNILGQKVGTLVSGKQNAGFHTVEWNASGFISGVYYYRLTTNQEFSKTKKLVLIR